MTAAENLRQQYRVLGLPSEGSISDLLRLVGLEGAGSKINAQLQALRRFRTFPLTV